MKKGSMIPFLVILGIACAIFAGCASTPGPGPTTTIPTTAPTTAPPTAPTTSAATTVPTTIPATVTTQPTTSGEVTVSLVAKNIAFDPSQITVPAGALVTIHFDNKDTGVPHNFALYTDSHATTRIFVGDFITGPNTITYTFTAPSTPGNYFFRCDVHPETMTGTFIVT
ncbi:MAG: cupredoxin domain-containing protein [Methanomicrobiales archaeon]|jgi:plastocyanin|nr:cupredoxin domain-containing protein [Methanomicrobiales archaeon]